MTAASLTWLGHASFRLDSPGGKRIYVDPWLDNPKCPAHEKSLARLASRPQASHDSRQRGGNSSLTCDHFSRFRVVSPGCRESVDATSRLCDEVNTA